MTVKKLYRNAQLTDNNEIDDMIEYFCWIDEVDFDSIVTLIRQLNVVDIKTWLGAGVTGILCCVWSTKSKKIKYHLNINNKLLIKVTGLEES